MDRLIEGYRRFRADIWPGERARYEALSTGGQYPETLVISCVDSRVDPQTVFGAVPGDLFVVRNVGALVPPYQPDAKAHGTSAALEFGVRVLKIKRIVVLGHAQCGGVRVMVEGAPEEARDFVAPWMSIAKPVLRLVCEAVEPAARLTYYEQEVVKLALANLLTFPWIDAAVAAGTLTLDGYRFDIHTGILSRLEGEAFVVVPSLAS